MPDLTGAKTRPSAQGFSQVYHVMTEDAGLSDGAFRTYVALLRFTRLGETWVGREQLATVRHIDVSTVSRHLTELANAGYITRQERKDLTAVTRIVPIDSVAQFCNTPVLQECNTEEYSKEVLDVSNTQRSHEGTAVEGTPGRVPGLPEGEKLAGTDARSRPPTRAAFIQRGVDYSEGQGDTGALPRNRHAAWAVRGEDEECGGDGEGQRPRWSVPESGEQEAFLAAVNAKYFEPRQKAIVKGIVARLRAGAILGEGVYAACDRQVESISDMHIRLPDVLPQSWWDRNLMFAKKHRWSRSNLLNAMLNRERLVEHLRYMLKKAPALTTVQSSGTIDADDYLSDITR